MARMKRFVLTLLAVAALGFLSMGGARAESNAFWGTGMGAALGGFLGSQIGKGDGQLAATGAGVFLGGAVGNSIGRSMDRANTAYAMRRGFDGGPYAPSYAPYEPPYVAPYDYPIETRAGVRDYVYTHGGGLEYYSPRQTVFVADGLIGVGPPVMPPPRHQGHRGRHCREFTQTIRMEGRSYESYGTACLRPDGSWQVEP